MQKQMVMVPLLVAWLMAMPTWAMASAVAKYDVSDKEFKLLTADLCSSIAGDGNNIAPKSDRILTNYLRNKQGISSPSKADKIKFLNRNKDKMICNFNGQHYMKFALDMGKHRDVFDKLFIDTLDIGSDNLFIDVNAVTLASDKKHSDYGQPETLLDYMDFIIATDKFGSAYSGEIKRLRAMLVEDFGAKKFSELPGAEQQRHRQRLGQ